MLILKGKQKHFAIDKGIDFRRSDLKFIKDLMLYDISAIRCSAIINHNYLSHEKQKASTYKYSNEQQPDVFEGLKSGKLTRKLSLGIQLLRPSK